MSTPPLILTAHVAKPDIAFFDDLRSRYFPPERNYLTAHVTMFHKLPAEHRSEVEDILRDIAKKSSEMSISVTGLRHLGSGVAFDIANSGLHEIRQELRERFRSLLGTQDLQPWKPHITVQNKVHWQKADALFDMLSEAFQPRVINVMGMDLWSYLQGPWQHERTFSFVATKSDYKESVIRESLRAPSSAGLRLNSHLDGRCANVDRADIRRIQCLRSVSFPRRQARTSRRSGTTSASASCLFQNAQMAISVVIPILTDHA